jgi:hypothetical protein
VFRQGVIRAPAEKRDGKVNKKVAFIRKRMDEGIDNEPTKKCQDA